jgi:hypothetical protein
MIFSFCGAKGGVGTTVAAVVTALQTGADFFVGVGSDGFAAAGLPSPSGPGDRPTVGGVTFIAADSAGEAVMKAEALSADGATVVLDLGTHEARADGATVVLVTTACYMALRRAIAGPTPDAVVLVLEPGRSLGAADVESVLGVEPVVVQWDPAVARAVDAGLLGARSPRPLAPLALLTPWGTRTPS